MLVITLPTRLGPYIIIKKKTNKGIYGTASNKEIKELKEEGVEAELIPWIEDKSN